MHFDYRTMRLAAVADMCSTLSAVDADQWELPSLCEGWQVRHVPSHLVTGYLFGPDQLGQMVAELGSVPAAARRAALDFAAAHDAKEIADAFEKHVGQPEPTGIAAVIAPEDNFVDQVIHRLDIAIPLGLPAAVPEEHLVAALEVMPSIEGFIGSKDRAAGLRLEAPDLGWASGEGPVVRGPATALVLALSGRPCGLEDLEGEGLATLAAKQGVDGRHLPGTA